MKIIKLKRIEESIYQLTYYNVWGLYKSVKIFPYFYGWRFLETGKELNHDKSVAISQMSKGLNIGDFMFTNID